MFKIHLFNAELVKIWDKILLSFYGFRLKYLKWSVIQITGKHRLFAMMIIYDLYSSNKIHQYSVVNIYRFIHFFTTEHHRDVYNGSWNPLER